MRQLLLVLGALIAIALTAVGTVITVDAIGTFSEVRIGDTRTPVPGQREVDLDEGKYVLFYEVADEDTVGDDEGAEVPPLRAKLVRTGGGRPLQLDDYSADFNVSSGGRDAQAFATVQVPEAGRYRLTVSAASDRDASPAVVLGRPVWRRILRLVLGIAGGVAGLALLALVSALAIGFAVRRPA